MDNHEESGRNAAILLDPLSVKPNINSFGDILIDWLIIGYAISIIMLYVTENLDFEPFFFSIVPAAMLLGGSRMVTKRNWRVAYIDTYQFPAAVKERVGKHYPHLSDEQLLLVMQGLRQYFQLCNNAANGIVSMPSRVVDVAWHEFILFTQAYQEFCQHGIGSFLHHMPAEEMTSTTELEEGMKKVWLLACEWERIDQQSPSRLPLLFEIDAALKIPDGFNHSLDNDYATIDNSSSTGCGGCGCGGC